MSGNAGHQSNYNIKSLRVLNQEHHQYVNISFMNQERLIRDIAQEIEFHSQFLVNYEMVGIHAWHDGMHILSSFTSTKFTLLCLFMLLCRIISIQIILLYAGKFLPSVARCIQSLPNLHTLQISSVEGKLATINTAFYDQSLLQIQTAIITDKAHHILKHCLAVKNVICMGFSNTPFFWMLSQCKMVEKLDIRVFDNWAHELEHVYFDNNMFNNYWTRLLTIL